MKSVYSKLCILFMITLTSETYAQKLNLLIGTYTKSGKSEGIYVYEFDAQSGKAVYKNKATGIENPSYLTLSKDEKFVYAVSEAGPGKGNVNAYTFEKNTGELNLLNTQPSRGDGPCYVSVDDKNNHVFLANYLGGSLTSIALNKDGSLDTQNQNFKYQGSSANKDRQQSPHAHSAVLAPNNKYLIVSDLGTDRINIYAYQPSNKSEPLSAAEPAHINTKPGSGPRHFEFHPNGKFAYSLQELTANISAFEYRGGNLELIQDISALPADFKGRIWAADIHISPDGKFLYSSNRDDANDIAIFSIDNSNGKLSLIGRHSTLGKAPRNFAIDPSGRFLLAANQNSDSIIIFKRDQKTGLLSDTGERITVGSPVCLKFAASN